MTRIHAGPSPLTTQESLTISRIALILFVFLLLPKCVSSPSIDDAILQQRQLFSVIAERLSHMESVAIYKAHHGLPIEDRGREEGVLRNTAREARALGVDEEAAYAFFQAQISIAKAVQYRCRADILTHSRCSGIVLDLQQEIRPQLDRLGEEIMQRLSTVLLIDEIEWSRSLFDEYLDIAYLKDADRQLLFDALLELKPAG